MTSHGRYRLRKGRAPMPCSERSPVLGAGCEIYGYSDLVARLGNCWFLVIMSLQAA